MRAVHIECNAISALPRYVFRPDIVLVEVIRGEERKLHHCIHLEDFAWHAWPGLL